MAKKFTRKIENFKCENCGVKVEGDGFTNHCPDCLWSKHVDNNPGDRQNACQGLMEPTGAFLQKQKWRISQRCTKCGEEANITSSEKDNKRRLLGLIENSTKTT